MLHRHLNMITIFLGSLRLGAVASLFAAVLVVSPHQSLEVEAKAPPHATTLVQTGVYATADLTAEQIGTLDRDVELELTGDAAPGFLGVIYGEGVAWIPSTNLTTGVRPGIETALALVDAPLLEAPQRDSGIVSYVPEGESVILTGASVDGFYAASFDGAGGWISGRDIAR